MYRVALFTLAFIWGSFSFPFEVGHTSNLPDRVSDILRERLVITTKTEEMSRKEERSPVSTLLRRFYSRRGFRPAWVSDSGLRSDAMILLKAIHNSDLEGLSPKDYHVAKIDTLLAQTRHNVERNRPTDPDRLADLDLLLSDAFLLYASHLSAGRVCSGTIPSGCFVKKQVADLVELLITSIEEAQIENALGQLKSQNDGYWLLKRYLMQYKKIMESGGWPWLADGPDLKKRDQGLRVADLRSRLTVSGDLNEGNEDDKEYFDEGLENAVRRFQKRHGLEVDGIVGRVTRRALNVPVEERIRQIRLNIERWRWLPNDFGRRYILVNITDFKLDVVENDQIVLTMKVVVGRASRPTPVLVSRITSVGLNPRWRIPTKISLEDIVPKIIKDFRYLAKANIRVFESWKEDAPEVDPESINWLQIRPENFPFRFRQEPGPTNALGRIKFIFPNKFQVYLHDTPVRGLFQKTKRSSSSGCIRVEKPFELVKYLFRSGKGWTSAKIIAALNRDKTQILRVPESVPVYVLYWTAWVDDGGILNFRDDIYGQDKPLYEALKDGLPTLSTVLAGEI